MNFGPKWSHGPRLVFRRVYEFFIGPTANVHLHYDSALWHFPVILPFVKWQRPVTDSRFHFDKCGVDLLFGPWIFCMHWIDH